MSLSDPSSNAIVREWDISAPGANTDAITDVTWPSSRACRVTIQVATSTVVNLMVDRGGTEFALGLNASSALTAGSLYTFDVYGLKTGDTVNLQVETDSDIPVLGLDEVF